MPDKKLGLRIPIIPFLNSALVDPGTGKCFLLCKAPEESIFPFSPKDHLSQSYRLAPCHGNPDGSEDDQLLNLGFRTPEELRSGE
jgi:hypothetical protein